MSGKTDFVQAVRKVAREEVHRVNPPIDLWRVIKKKPLMLEAFASELRLTEGDADFDIAYGIRGHVKVGDVIAVATTASGDYVALGLGTVPGSTETSGGGGGGGEDKTYAHSQGVAAKEWKIKHSLGKEPCVVAFDTTDQEIGFQQIPVDDDNVILKFNIDISGRAVLN